MQVTLPLPECGSSGVFPETRLLKAHRVKSPPHRLRNRARNAAAACIPLPAPEFAHPDAAARVIAGQATGSKALIPSLDSVRAPSGGGMVSGLCLTLQAFAPSVEIYAAEPETPGDAPVPVHNLQPDQF